MIVTLSYGLCQFASVTLQCALAKWMFELQKLKNFVSNDQITYNAVKKDISI